MSNKVINKKILEALVFSGSLSSLENNQNFLAKNIEKLVGLNVVSTKITKKSVNLFDNFFDKDFDSSNLTM